MKKNKGELCTVDGSFCLLPKKVHYDIAMKTKEKQYDPQYNIRGISIKKYSKLTKFN